MAAGSYSLAAFHLDVTSVFHELAKGLDEDSLGKPDLLNGVSANEWLANGHPCVKLRISGDSNNPLPPDTDSPKANRRIAQRNLEQFDHLFLTQAANAVSPWHNFIVEQPLTLFDREGRSTVRLTLQS